MKAEKNKITASAPGKLLLLGDHAVVYGYPCLVTAVNYRVFVEVSLSDTDEFVLPEGTGNSFIQNALELFRKKFETKQPIIVKTWARYEESYGLGSSSAVTVAFVKALSELFSISLSKKEMFDFCYEVVLKVQGVGSGFDIAAAIWGRTLYFVTGGTKIEPVNISEIPLVVAYSGTKGNTSELVKKVAKLKRESKRIDELFMSVGMMVDDAKDWLVAKNFKGFGHYMDQYHTILQEIGVSTPKLNSLVDAARSAGAYGAKLSGAGGGDCMIAVVSPDNKETIEKVLAKAGGKVLDVTTNEEGVRIE